MGGGVEPNHGQPPTGFVYSLGSSYTIQNVIDLLLTLRIKYLLYKTIIIYSIRQNIV